MGPPGQTSLGRQAGTPALEHLKMEAHMEGVSEGGARHPLAALEGPPSAGEDSPVDASVSTPVPSWSPPRRLSVSFPISFPHTGTF